MVSCRVVVCPLERDGSFQYQSAEQSPSANIDTEDLNVHFIPGRTGMMCWDLLERRYMRWGTVSDSHCLAGACQEHGEVIGIAMCSHRRNAHFSKVIMLLSQSLLLKPVLHWFFCQIWFSCWKSKATTPICQSPMSRIIRRYFSFPSPWQEGVHVLYVTNALHIQGSISLWTRAFILSLHG